jgi:excinuclease ABC subunit A
LRYPQEFTVARKKKRRPAPAERVIHIRGAREHNLKDVDLDLPRETFVVITGVSGSGKSSLAFDTIYAEGQRRYIESLSSYARQFLEQMGKPAVESITGLPPTISIEQRKSAHNPRSTVATVTEIYDYMRLLWARTGLPHCPRCGKKVARMTPGQMADAVQSMSGMVLILAPVVEGRKGEHRDVFDAVRAEGFVRVRVDGRILRLPPVPTLDKNLRHDIAVVVDRIQIRDQAPVRLVDSIEIALRLGAGRMIASQGPKDRIFSERFACADCRLSLGELAPRLFSFNSPYGACPSCGGLGTRMELDPELIVPDPDLSIHDGAIEAWRKGGRRMAIFFNRISRALERHHGVDIHMPFRRLPRAQQRLVLEGAPSAKGRKAFEGVLPNLLKRFKRTRSEFIKRKIHEFMSEGPCPDCSGARLRPEALGVTIRGRSIQQVAGLDVGAARTFFRSYRPAGEAARVAKPVLKEIRARLAFLENVGLGYLTLDRRAGTLSGGEAQRIRLASQVGSALVGVCYVLDEPTIGLHSRDNARLLATLENLRDLGNTVVVVEHDLDTIRRADHVVDMGPGPGEAGGHVVAQGPPHDLAGSDDSLTAKYLRGDLSIPVPRKRRPLDPKQVVVVSGAAVNNLKNLTVSFPLGVVTCVTGVSGSGKSSLVTEILLKSLRRRLHGAREKPGRHKSLRGHRLLDKVVPIDQSPIGRTSRSNPATYTGVFDDVRRLFAKTREARARGYQPGRFSFNRPGGRCGACEGHGNKRIEMHFLPDVWVRCAECEGRRYNRETLEIRYRGRNIADVLDMSVTQALAFFENFPLASRILRTLDEVGLGYLRLGQPSTTLSGGEAQRVKLASELARVQTGRTLYVLDEPTTGLHLADISRLLDVLNRLCERGNTIIIIEHNLDVIKTADWVIDLGPEGGDAGGELVTQGKPEAVRRVKKSHTGQALAAVLTRKRK